MKIIITIADDSDFAEVVTLMQKLNVTIYVEQYRHLIKEVKVTE